MSCPINRNIAPIEMLYTKSEGKWFGKGFRRDAARHGDRDHSSDLAAFLASAFSTSAFSMDRKAQMHPMTIRMNAIIQRV